MHEFKFKSNELHCEGIRVADIAGKVPTPFYLYSHKTLVDHYRKLKSAFRPLNPLICFSMKSNSNLAVLRALVRSGAESIRVPSKSKIMARAGKRPWGEWVKV